MSNHTYPRRLLDDAIDRAVHELVQGEPRPGFRRRVLTKLNAPAQRQLWISRVLVPAGTLAAVLVLAVWLRPQTAPRVEPPAAPVVAQRTTPAAESAPPQPVVEDAAKPRVAARPTDRRDRPVQFTFGRPSDRVAATSIANAEGVESASVAGEVLPPAIAPLQVTPLPQLPEIALRPIEIKPIGVGQGSR